MYIKILFLQLSLGRRQRVKGTDIAYICLLAWCIVRFPKSGNTECGQSPAWTGHYSKTWQANQQTYEFNSMCQTPVEKFDMMSHNFEHLPMSYQD